MYKKLVRDLIPLKIVNSGKQFPTKILNNEEYIKELKNKSFEELEEYMKAENNENAIEELVDLLFML